LRIWVDNELIFDEILKIWVQDPFANDHYAMIFLASSSNVPRPPQGDVSVGGWTDHAGSGTSLYRAINSASADDGTYVQSPLNPSGASYVTELEITEDPAYRDYAHRTVTTYQYRKDQLGGQPVDLTVELLKRVEGGWEVMESRTHRDISESPTNGEIATTNPDFHPGRYALRFTATGGAGDARRALVMWATWRTTHTSRRIQDDYIRFGDIYVSGVPYDN
jgi:hypothetical protein